MAVRVAGNGWRRYKRPYFSLAVDNPCTNYKLVDLSVDNNTVAPLLRYNFIDRYKRIVLLNSGLVASYIGKVVSAGCRSREAININYGMMSRVIPSLQQRCCERQHR